MCPVHGKPHGSADVQIDQIVWKLTCHGGTVLVLVPLIKCCTGSMCHGLLACVFIQPDDLSMVLPAVSEVDEGVDRSLLASTSHLNLSQRIKSCLGPSS